MHSRLYKPNRLLFKNKHLQTCFPELAFNPNQLTSNHNIIDISTKRNIEVIWFGKPKPNVIIILGGLLNNIHNSYVQHLAHYLSLHDFYVGLVNLNGYGNKKRNWVYSCKPGYCDELSLFISSLKKYNHLFLIGMSMGELSKSLF